jgi:hypothetical protein
MLLLLREDVEVCSMGPGRVVSVDLDRDGGEL